MDNVIFLVSAYGFIWLIIAYYFYVTGRKVNKLESRLKRLMEEQEEKYK